jgi:hypothetical protein
MSKAIRPLFVPSDKYLVEEKKLEFEWFMGMNRTQKQKSITEFHKKAKEIGYLKILEISTYSMESLGVNLSAFNLHFISEYSSGTVEELYQKSKIIKEIDKKNIVKKRNYKGLLPSSFEFEKKEWPLKPLSGFYDWLYINALIQNPTFSTPLLEFQAFTDIAYNPKKSLSTQARSAALYVTLVKLKKIDEARDPKKFLKLLNNYNYMCGPQTLF